MAVADLLWAVTEARLGEVVAAALVLLELELELGVVAAAGARLQLVWRCQPHDKIYMALGSKGHRIV